MSHMYESRPICRSHVTYGWVTSRMQESCPIWRSHVTHGFCTRLGLKFWASNHVPYEGVMSYGWVMSHIHAYILMSFCTSLVLKSKRSYVLMCSIRLWIVSYFPQKALIFHKNRQIFHETCHISIKYLLFFIHTVSRFHFHLIKNEVFDEISLMSMKWNASMLKTCLIFFNVWIFVWWRCLALCVHVYGTWLIDMWHDSLIWDMTDAYGTWLIHMWHDSCIWDTTHQYLIWLLHMWHDSSICDKLQHMGHDLSICVIIPSYGTWLICWLTLYVHVSCGKWLSHMKESCPI